MYIRTKEDAIRFRNEITKVADVVDDKTASMCVDFYDGMKFDGSLIKVNTRINFNNQLYKAALDLWDTVENTPDAAPTLWSLVDYVDGIEVIPEIVTAERAWQKDQLGYWKADGNIYKSLIDNNVWNPTDYPAGWELQNS